MWPDMLANTKNLRSLVLQFGERLEFALSDLLRSISENCPQLDELVLSWEEFPSSKPEDYENSRPCLFLKSLILRECLLTRNDFHTLATLAPKLTELFLFESGREVILLQDYLAHWAENLKTLVIYSRYDNPHRFVFRAPLPSLEFLCISLTFEADSLIAPALKKLDYMYFANGDNGIPEHRLLAMALENDHFLPCLRAIHLISIPWASPSDSIKLYGKARPSLELSAIARDHLHSLFVGRWWLSL